MKRLCLVIILLSVAFTANSAAAELPVPVVQAFESYCSLPGQLIPILKTASDKESATSAAQQLQAALPRIYHARDLLHHMPALTPQQNQQVRMQYEKRMLSEWNALYGEIERVRNANCFGSKELARAYNIMCLMIEK